MDRRAIYALIAAVAAGAAYWYYNKNKNSSSQEQPQDQGPAEAAMSNYTQSPSISAQAYTSGGAVYTNQGQAQPLPYNG